jgi:RNA-directed DNA polymerase
VNYIFDADLRSFFDSVSQQWLIRFLKHRINDTRVLRLIQKWLKAGVLEDGVVTVSDRGTGQGSVISPLLANVYLHYVFDLWAERWRHREAVGNVIIVRYADDLIIGFELDKDARRSWRGARRRRLAPRVPSNCPYCVDRRRASRDDGPLANFRLNFLIRRLFLHERHELVEVL